MRSFTNARDALRDAYCNAPRIIGWKSGEGWIVYRADQPPSNVKPELLVMSTGHLPLPLCESGVEVMLSIFKQEVFHSRWEPEHKPRAVQSERSRGPLGIC